MQKQNGKKPVFVLVLTITFVVLSAFVPPSVRAGQAGTGRIEIRTRPRPGLVAQEQSTRLSPKDIAGRWEGLLDAGAVKVSLVLHVVEKEGGLSATVDSPDQGATGLIVDTISFRDNSLQFEMKALSAVYEGKPAKDGSQFEGEWIQQGQHFKLIFKRAAGTEAAQNSLRLEKVDVNGHSLNFLTGGQGVPAVIFEAGLGSIGIGSWSTVQREVATFAHTASYDRAGVGQSELGPKPRSAKQIALELHVALQKLGIKPPYVLVGHSVGGLYIRVFADLYSQEVAGMVLIDPSQQAFDAWIKTHMPDGQKEAAAQIAKGPEGMQAEWAALDATYSQAEAAKVPAGIPVTLLSAGGDSSISAAGRKFWIEKHQDWIGRIPGGKHVIAEQSGHLIQMQEPQLVLEAIRQVVNLARKR